MKMQFQKPLLFGLLLSLLPSCQSGPSNSDAWDHWNASSVPPRIERFFLSYDPDRDGAYIDKVGKDIAHVRQIGNRLFLHKNTDNPFQHNYSANLRYEKEGEGAAPHLRSSYKRNKLCSNTGACYCPKCAAEK